MPITPNGFETPDGSIKIENGGNQYAEMYISATAPTEIDVGNTYEKALGTTTLGDYDSTYFDMPANNRLRYLGSSPVKFEVTAQITYSVAQVNRIGFKIYKYDDSATSGSVIDKSEMLEDIDVADDYNIITCSCFLELDENDYVELWITSNNATDDITIQKMNFRLKKLL